MSDLAPGTKIARWTIQRKLGQGGMGAVYEALDPQLGRSVALKFMLADDPDLQKRFEREVSAAVSMHDPNVAATYACFPHQGRLVMVVELLPGGTLKGRVKERGPLSWREAARFGVGIARGLAAVHRMGWVHRDLKPENVMLDAGGVPKLTDFGLVRTSVGKGSIALTKTGEVVGTVEFMSPEQADGAKVDHRADLYALGATLYYLVTGRPPFEGGQYQILKKILVDTPVAPSKLAPDLPPELDGLIMELLAKKPDQRPASAEAVASRLEALSGPVKEPASRRGGVVALALGVAVVAGLGGAVLATRPWEKKPAPSPPVTPPPPPVPAHVVPPPPKPPAPPPLKDVRVVAFALKGGEPRLLAGGDDKLVHVFVPGSGKEEPPLEVGGPVRDMAARGSLVVIGLGNMDPSTAIAWDLDRGPLGASSGHSGDVVVDLSPDGKEVISVGQRDHNFHRWNPEKGADGSPFAHLGVVGAPFFVRFRGDSVLVGLASGSPPETNGLLGTLGEKEPMLVEPWVKAHGRGATTCGAFLRHDPAGLFATVGTDGMLVVHGGPKLEPLARAHAAPKGKRDLHALECLQDGSIVTGDADGTCLVWKFTPGPPAWIEQTGAFKSGNGKVHSIAESPDGNLLATGGDDGKVRFFARKEGEWRQTWPEPVGAQEAPPAALNPVAPVRTVGTGRRVRGLVFFPYERGLRLIHGGDDGQVHVYDLVARKDEATIVGFDAAIRNLALTGDGRRALVGMTDGTLAMLDLIPPGRVLDRRKTHVGDVCVALSPDGKRAVSAGNDRDRVNDRTIIEWDLAKGSHGEPFLIDADHGNWFLRYVDDGNFRDALVGLDNAGGLARIDLRARRLAKPPERSHSDKGTTLGVYLHGPHEGHHFLATSGNDFHVSVHDDEGRVVAEESIDKEREQDWKDERNRMLAVEALPDGTLVTGDPDGFVRRWRFDGRRVTPTEHFLKIAARVVSLAASPDGRLLAVGGEDGVSIFDIASWQAGR